MCRIHGQPPCSPEWLFRSLPESEAYDLLELVDVCSRKGALIRCTQYDVDDWYYRIDCDRAEDERSAAIVLCELIDELLKGIRHLELECIYTKYLLSQHISAPFFRHAIRDIFVRLLL